MQKTNFELWQTLQKARKALVFQCLFSQNVQLFNGSEELVNLYQLNQK